jgi:arylsulfatase A-like enzyme
MSMKVRRSRAASIGGFLLAACIAVTAVPPAPTVARAAARGSAPNVLIIVTDDQRADTLKVQQHTRRLIREKGVRFTDAYTTTPTCCPARATIFTGRYPHNHGVRTNDGTTTENLDHSTTLQAYLQGIGYRTALFGKYLNGWNRSTNPPHFDRWAFFSGRDGYYFGSRWNVDGKQRYVSRYSTSFIRRQALDFIGSAEARRRPWLTFLTTAAPHAPFTPQRRYRGADVPPFEVTPAMQEEDRSDKPPYVQAVDRPVGLAREVNRGQLRTLLSVDDLVRSVIEKLVRTKQAEDTLIIYMSDNGYLHSEHRLTGKTAPYLPSIKIPLVMRFPGRVSPGTDERLVSNIDVAPTVLDAVGIEPPTDPPMDGRSLLDRTWERDHLLLEYFRRIRRGTPEWGATLTKEDQYIEYYEDGGRINAIFREYYDLVTDPYQLENPLGNQDPADDPLLFPLRAQQLDEDRQCEGTTGPNACP